MDGLPVAGAETPIDAFRLGLHLDQQVLVALDARAARRANLDEGKTRSVLPVLVEEALDGQEPLNDALRVVDAIDAHAKKRTRVESEPDRLVGGDWPGVDVLQGVLRERHAD